MAARLPNTACIATPGWKGETQVMQMDLAGFAISAGSACSSRQGPGKPRAARDGLRRGGAGSAIRVSLGPATTEDEVLRFAEAWGGTCEEIPRPPVRQDRRPEGRGEQERTAGMAALDSDRRSAKASTARRSNRRLDRPASTSTAGKPTSRWSSRPRA
jgi:hypothetical protein